MLIFKPGDLVELKSGGIIMTVRGIVNNFVNCQWVEDGKMKSGGFAPESLKAVLDPKQT
jgi:uncharacterized protein YodC (DUF2158 family)